MAAGSSTSSERTGRLVFWLGLLAVCLVFLIESFITANWTFVRVFEIVVTLIYLAVLGVAGWLHRRTDAVIPAVVLLAVAGVLQSLPDLVTDLGMWWYDNGAWVNALSYTLIFAAWLSVRRARGTGWALLIPVAIVEYLFLRVVVRAVFVALPYEIGAHAWPITVAASTAFLALAALVAGRLSDGPAPSTPSAWPAAGQPALGQPAPGQPAVGWPVAASPAQPMAGNLQYAPQYAVGSGQVPPWAYGRPRTNALAVVALVMGIIGVSLGGIICGHIALSQIRRTEEGGRGMAVAGLVLGYAWLAVVVVALIAVTSAASSAGY